MGSLAKQLGWGRSPGHPSHTPASGHVSALATLARLRDELEVTSRSMGWTALAHNFAAAAVGIAALALLGLVAFWVAPTCSASGTPTSVTVGSSVKLGGC